MGLSINRGPWWPETDFVCPQCGELRSGILNSKELIYRVMRFCDCGYLETRPKDAFAFVNTGVSLLNLEAAPVPDFLANPVCRRNNCS